MHSFLALLTVGLVLFIVIGIAVAAVVTAIQDHRWKKDVAKRPPYTARYPLAFPTPSPVSKQYVDHQVPRSYTAPVRDDTDGDNVAAFAAGALIGNVLSRGGDRFSDDTDTFKGGEGGSFGGAGASGGWDAPSDTTVTGSDPTPEPDYTPVSSDSTECTNSDVDSSSYDSSSSDSSSSDSSSSDSSSDS